MGSVGKYFGLTRSNNSPDNIAHMYITTMREFGACPVQLVHREINKFNVGGRIMVGITQFGGEIFSLI